MAAENGGPATAKKLRAVRFNEAAAHGRGKLSTPPRPPASSPCFNEAAAHGRGKPWRFVVGPPLEAACFNEAAAHGRGKLRPRPGDGGEPKSLQ